MQTHFKFTPTKSTADMRTETGNPDFKYELGCTEICGKGHFSMRLIVVVDEPADYEKWKASQSGVVNQNFESALESLQNLEKEKQNNRNIDMVKYQESIQREYSNYLLSYVPKDLVEVAFIKGIQGSVEKEVNGKKIIRTELQRRQQADSLISVALKYRQSDNNQVSASLK